MNKHKFKFNVKDHVEVLDYSMPRKRHSGIITKRWLEEINNIPASRKKEAELAEHYDVLVFKNGKPINCMFLGQDISEGKKVNE